MKPLPETFEESIRRQLGNDFSDFIQSLSESPPVSIRLNPVKANTQDKNPPVPWSESGRYLRARPVFTLDPLFHAGTYYVQEASSMFLEQALEQTVDLSKPLNVLDLCAAPGGKSTHLLSLINRDSVLVSNEAIRSRASVLSENIQKWGYPNAFVTNNDPSDFKSFQGFFDVVVVDAPCSGEGLFRKEPGAMEEWTPQNVQLCASRQKRIISDVWDSLRENGIFIYCTCTYNHLENEDNLKWLGENHHVEFLKLEIDPSWNIEEVREGKVTAYRFYPHKTRGEGFFLSVFRKLERVESIRLKTKQAIATPPKKIQERLTEWLVDAGASTFFQFNDLVFYTPSSRVKETETIVQNLKIMYAGTNVASIKHEKLIPEHAVAMSVELNREHFPGVELSEEQALKYLRRESIALENPVSGFTLVTYKHQPLGWTNVLSNRVNNLYPTEWRIRMS